MEISWSLKPEHSSAESTAFIPEFGETCVLLEHPDWFVKNSKISSWLKQNLESVDNYDPAMLFVAPWHYCPVWGVLCPLIFPSKSMAVFSFALVSGLY